MSRADPRAVCDSCRHFAPEDRLASSGECRVLPPTLVSLGAAGRVRTAWPVVEDQHWCGRHDFLQTFAEPSR